MARGRCPSLSIAARLQPGLLLPARGYPGAAPRGLSDCSMCGSVLAGQTTAMNWWPSNLQSCQNKGDLAMEALLEGIQNRGHSGGFLTSCEAELQELMKQIDIMVAHKKSEWEGQTHALETCLDIRDRELKTLRSQLDMKHKEVGVLHQQIEEHEKTKQQMALEYKQELKKLQEELGRLKRSYEKLQKKQLKEFKGTKKSLREDRSEIERLTGKIEEFRQKSLDWEKQRLVYQQQVSSLEAQRKALAEQSEIIQALQEEQKELKASLQSQENFILEEKRHKEKLQTKLKALDTHHSVESMRPLEDCQVERNYPSPGQGVLDNVLSQLDFSHTSEELLQAEVTRLEGSLESVSTTCKQLSEELMEKYEELKRMEGHNNEYRTEIKKLKEQILQADQTYSSALEGMKMEISQLTRELHQRDITIASAKCSSSDMEKQLKAEMQKAEEKAAEHKEILSQLESLKLENRRLSETVMKLELGLHEAKEISLADLQENYIEALNKLVSENQQLQKDLMDTKSQLEHATHMCKKKDGRIFKPARSRAAEFKNTEFKPTHGQHRHDGIQTEQYKTGHHSPREQTLDSVDPMARGPSPPSPPTSPDSSTVSLPSNFLCHAHSLPSVLDINDANFSDILSDCMNDQEEYVPACSLPVSPLGSIATRFLEEEELRSHHILERLDAHIEELRRESERTVRQFTALV
ncbi:centrosomal protein of 63 kDa isoform X4 [Peromyscus leucopus]|uniref:centrosomal protein of 63 kDa isoform X4 n=1 Tax=Peromyscus leucopus TaxID=10041 RepID=UPI0010A124B9|nr:centrosomal protein of 63 kDa isoform X4 [Peromyscus leucopus]